MYSRGNEIRRRWKKYDEDEAVWRLYVCEEKITRKIYLLNWKSWLTCSSPLWLDALVTESLMWHVLNQVILYSILSFFLSAGNIFWEWQGWWWVKFIKLMIDLNLLCGEIGKPNMEVDYFEIPREIILEWFYSNLCNEWVIIRQICECGSFVLFQIIFCLFMIFSGLWYVFILSSGATSIPMSQSCL